MLNVVLDAHSAKKNQKLQFLIFQLVKYCNRYWGLFSNPSHCNIMSKNSSETVPDCFLSRPSLNISYCQSGPQPTLMTGEAAQGGHTDTHTQVQPPPVASHANTYRDSIIVLLIKKGGIIWMKIMQLEAVIRKKKKRLACKTKTV